MLTRPSLGRIYVHIILENVKYSINLAEEAPLRVSAIRNGNFIKIYANRIFFAPKKYATVFVSNP